MAKKRTVKRKRPTKPTRPAKPAKTVGILHSGTAGKHDKEMAALFKALKTAGYDKGNLTIAPKGDPLWSDDDPKQLSDNADTLAKITGINLIIAAGGTASAYAARDATKTNNVPVVFTTFSQATSPASNMTGVCAQTSGLDVARMQKLYEANGKPSRIGFLANNTRPNYDSAPLDSWFAAKNVTPDPQYVYKKAGEVDQDVKNRIEQAFANLRKNTTKFALVCADPIFNNHRQEVIDGAKGKNANEHIVTMYQWKEFKDDGADKGDQSFGTILSDAYSKAGEMAGQVLDDPSGIAGMVVYTLQNYESGRRKAARRSPPKRGKR
jgi:putative ABC transport system substrate-binding protein